MNEQELSTIIDRLDAEVSKDGAVVKFEEYCGDDSRVVATPAGYLRLGIEMLKAARARGSEAKPDVIDVDLEYLHPLGTEISFISFLRRTELEKEEEQEQYGPWVKLIPAALLSFLVVSGILAVIGLVQVIRWIAT